LGHPVKPCVRGHVTFTAIALYSGIMFAVYILLAKVCGDFEENSMYALLETRNAG
jgi:hypothetical protein